MLRAGEGGGEVREAGGGERLASGLESTLGGEVAGREVIGCNLVSLKHTSLRLRTDPRPRPQSLRPNLSLRRLFYRARTRAILTRDPPNSNSNKPQPRDASLRLLQLEMHFRNANTGFVISP